MAFKVAFLIFALTLIGSCSDRPSREKFPGTAGNTVGFEASQVSSQALMGGFDASKQGIAAAQEEIVLTLEGNVSVDPKVKFKPDTALYINLRPVDGGRPLAVKRLLASDLPYDFIFTKYDVMVPGTPFEGEVLVTAALDQDGDAWTRQEGDWEGSVTSKIGDKKVKVIINTPRKAE